ncbi:MAG TPA: hypothetical protein VHA55_00995 [Pseudorhodoplanes sp.]|nr:hypothetical protein [Pseudorhodoplanes sp.]
MPMYLVGFPLLLIPVALYNIVAFLFRTDMGTTLFTVRMMSGGEWAVSISDVLLVIGILMLFVEILKSTRIGNRSIVDHMLSLVLLLVMLAEFIMVRAAATSTFFLLSAMSLVDVVAGFTITIRTAQRDIGIDAVESLKQSS